LATAAAGNAAATAKSKKRYLYIHPLCFYAELSGVAPITPP